MNCNNILGISVDERNEHAVEIQKVLTKYGCEIMARLGLPQQGVNSCTNKGLLILQICANEDCLDEIVEELNTIKSVTAQYMTL